MPTGSDRRRLGGDTLPNFLDSDDDGDGNQTVIETRTAAPCRRRHRSRRPELPRFDSDNDLTIEHRLVPIIL